MICPHCTDILLTWFTAVTSWWARWHLKSSGSRLFVQPLAQAQIKENIKALLHCPLWGESTSDREREREIKFIGLFGDRGHRGPYSPYKPCYHNLYIEIIIFPHIDNPQSIGCNWLKKKTIKIINEKSEGPINLTNHWRKRLWISLHVDLKWLN